MGGVVEAIGDAIGDVVEAVGDVAEAVVDVAVDVVEAVGDAVESTVEAAVNDPIGTIAKVAAVATGNAYLIPYISAASVVANGGNLEQALIAGGTAYVAQGVANYVAADFSAANQFDTTPFSEQTRMLAEQNAGLVANDQLSTAIGSAAGSATRTALQGGDVGDILTSGLTGGAGSYVGQEVKSETADLLGKTGSTIAGNVAGATTAGVLQGKDLENVFGNSLVNNLINVNLANMNSGKGNEPVKKAETQSDITTAYENLNPADKQFVDMAVATGTDVTTAVNYAMANPTLETKAGEGDKYAALDTGTKTDAGGGDYWKVSADGSTRTAPDGTTQSKNADGTWPESQGSVSISDANDSASETKPEFRYGSNGDVFALEKDGTYQKMEYVKVSPDGKIMTADINGKWTVTDDYAKGTEVMRSKDSDRMLNADELAKGYYYASDGSMRTPEGSMFIKIYGGGNVTSPEEAVVAPGSEFDKAVNKIGGLLGLGGGDPNATYSALFGGGAYIKGELDMSAASPLGWGTKEDKDQALNYMEIVLNDPNATAQDKQLAQQAINRINESPVKGTVGGQTAAGGEAGSSTANAGTTSSSSSADSPAAFNPSTANYVSSTVKTLADSGYKDSEIATLLANTFGLDQNKANNLTNIVTNNGIDAGNEFLLLSSNWTGSEKTNPVPGGSVPGGSVPAGTDTAGTVPGGTGPGGTGPGGTGPADSGPGNATDGGGGGGKEVVDPKKTTTTTGGTSTSTGSSAVSALSYGSSGAPSSASQTGALPKGLNASYLSAAPLQDNNMNLGQLKQLYPQLAAVDPRILSTITGKSNAPAGGATGLTSGNIAMPSAGYPAQASGQSGGGIASFMPTNDLMNNSYDALSSAGLRSLGALPSAGSVYGLKKGGSVKNKQALPHVPEFITGKTGHYVEGKGDGQSDDIPAMLADGEYVFDADTVAQLGNGSSKAGAQLLDHFRESLREHKRSAPTDKIPPAASPLAYMKAALKKHKG
jgi:hypothetical protein